MHWWCRLALQKKLLFASLLLCQQLWNDPSFFFLWRGPFFGWHSVPTFSVLWGYLKKLVVKTLLPAILICRKGPSVFRGDGNSFLHYWSVCQTRTNLNLYYLSLSSVAQSMKKKACTIITHYVMNLRRVCDDLPIRIRKKGKRKRKLFPVQHLPWSQMESKISTLWRFGSSWSAFFQIICMSRTSECRVHAAALNLNVMKFKYHPEFLLASLWRGGTRDDCNGDDNIKKNVL